MIRVMLVDDFHIVREGMKACLSNENDMTIVGVAASGEEAIDNLEEIQPDIIVMDIHMPEMGGIKAGIQIKKMYPDTKIIYMTSFADEDLVITGINAGADGFLYKKIDGSVLVQTIRNVHANQLIIAGEAANILARRIRDIQFNKEEVLDRKLKARNIVLTSREIEVAALLMQDKTNEEIANALHLSQGTVKNYISEIYNKLQINRRGNVIDYLNSLFEDQEML